MNHACASVQSLDLSYRFSHENLHIRLKERFDLPQAGIVISLLRHYRQNCKRIFIDVRGIRAPHAAAVSALKSSFLQTDIAPDRIIFKGETGFALAVSGNRVLLVPQKKQRCCGNCANCGCKHKKPADPNASAASAAPA